MFAFFDTLIVIWLQVEKWKRPYLSEHLHVCMLGTTCVIFQVITDKVPTCLLSLISCRGFMNSMPCCIGWRVIMLLTCLSPLLVMCADWSLNCAEVRMCVGVTYITIVCLRFFFSGAQGEYAGLAAIKAYLNSKGESARSVSVLMLGDGGKKTSVEQHSYQKSVWISVMWKLMGLITIKGFHLILLSNTYLPNWIDWSFGLQIICTICSVPHLLNI